MAIKITIDGREVKSPLAKVVVGLIGIVLLVVVLVAVFLLLLPFMWFAVLSMLVLLLALLLLVASGSLTAKTTLERSKRIDAKRTGDDPPDG